MRRWIAVLTLTLLAAGCGGAQEEAPAAQQAASPATSSASAELSLADASARYLEIVAPYNTAVEEFEDAAQSGQSWTKLRDLAAKVAQANKAHGQLLRDTAWPAQVREPMAALLTEIDAAQPYWEKAAQAKTEKELTDAVLAAVEHSGAKQAGAVRQALGLPPYTES